MMLQTYMASDWLITGTASVAFGVLSIVLWQDYLAQTDEVYGARDAAQAELRQIDLNLGGVQDNEEFARLSSDRTRAELLEQEASRRINDIDGWNALDWKVKNSLRLAAPALAAVFAVFTVLPIVNPLGPRHP
jgi:hypothetical protein